MTSESSILTIFSLPVKFRHESIYNQKGLEICKKKLTSSDTVSKWRHHFSNTLVLVAVWRDDIENNSLLLFYLQWFRVIMKCLSLNWYWNCLKSRLSRYLLILVLRNWMKHHEKSESNFINFETFSIGFNSKRRLKNICDMSSFNTFQVMIIKSH